jgi:hypothetical protein
MDYIMLMFPIFHNGTTPLNHTEAAINLVAAWLPNISGQVFSAVVTTFTPSYLRGMEILQITRLILGY